MNAFETHGLTHLSASQLNLWIAAPSLWVMEKLLKKRGGMGCAAHRGTAAEAGISAGLFDPSLSHEDCVAVAMPVYDRLTALSGDPKRDAERAVIPGMIQQGLALREHGLPIRPNEGDQHKIEVRLEGVSVPIIGYLDWLYPEEVLDLKTTNKIPSEMSESHIRQAAIYKCAHYDKRIRFAYTSSKKMEKHTLKKDQYEKAIKQIQGSAKRLEKFLSLSRDPLELAEIVPHGTDNFYWSDATTKANGVSVFGY